MDLDHMPLRGRAHSRLRFELNRQGALHRHELELLLDAADALLFDEPESALLRAQALDLLNRLESSERRTSGEVARLRAALHGCAAPFNAMAA